MSDLVKQLERERCEAQEWELIAKFSGVIGGVFGFSSYLLYSAVESIRSHNTQLGQGPELGMPEQLYACMSYMLGISSVAFLISAGLCVFKCYQHEKNARNLESRILDWREK